MIFKGVYTLQPGTYKLFGVERVLKETMRFDLSPIGNSDKYLINDNWFNLVSKEEILAFGENLKLQI